MSGVYYPSCVAHVELRFDENLHLVETPAPTNTQTVAERPPTGTTAPDGPPLITRRGENNGSFVLNRVPVKAHVDLNGYRQAGTFALSLDWRDIPLDPRTIRAALVELHYGTVSAEDFAAGMRGENYEGVSPAILNTRDDAGHRRLDTLAILGLVDDISVVHGETGSEVTFKGRDFRGILLDTPISPPMLTALILTNPIDDVVRQIILHHPAGERMTVSIVEAEWPDGVVPSPGSSSPAATPRHRRGARGRRTGGRAAVRGGTQMNFWDAIVHMCNLVGAIPYYRGEDLVIRPAHAIFDQQRASYDSRIRTPFNPDQPRHVDGREFVVRRMLYGRGIQSLTFNRKLAGHNKPHAIRCIGGVHAGVRQEGWWPDRIATPENPETPAHSSHQQQQLTTNVAPGGQQAHTEVLNYSYPAIIEENQLRAIARSIYTEIGRQEIGGSCETKDLASFGGDNQDPDLVRLRPGDAMEFYTDTRSRQSGAPLTGTIVDFSRNAFETVVAELTSRIHDENLARVIVATARNQVAELQNFFRVSAVSLDWAKASGIGVKFDFQNYVVTRFDQAVSSTPRAAAAPPRRTAVPGRPHRPPASPNQPVGRRMTAADDPAESPTPSTVNRSVDPSELVSRNPRDPRDPSE